MSQTGHERTKAEVCVTSALPPTCRISQHVCFVPKGDIGSVTQLEGDEAIMTSIDAETELRSRLLSAKLRRG